MQPTLKYPAKVGFAGDLFAAAFDSQTPLPNGWPSGEANVLLHLGDLLLLHDTVLVRSDAWTLHYLFTTFSVDELRDLGKNNRLRFFAAMSTASYGSPAVNAEVGPTGEYFSELSQKLKVLEDFMLSPANVVTEFVEAHSVKKQVMSIHSAKEVQKVIFNGMSPDFSKLPTPPGQELYHDVGLRTGLGRILDIWSSGVTAVRLDPEMAVYLSLCDPEEARALKPRLVDGSSISDLHRMNNVPSLANLVAEGRWSKKEVLSVLIGDEAARLREWLSKNLTADVDVRDAYFRQLLELPSKQKWASWARFGVTSTTSFCLAMVLTGNPVLAKLLGLATGGASVQWGENAMSRLLDPYHPRDWISYFKRKL